MLKRKLLLIPAALVLGAIGLSSLAGCSGNDDKTISFDAKGGKEVADMTVQWGTTVKAADLPTTTKTGYTFASWCTDEAATNPFSERVVEDNFKLYAKWSINSYTVSYYDSDATTKLRDDAVYTYGSEIDVTDFEKANYKFEGWYTTSDYDKDTKVSEGYKMPGHNVSLYAKWNANHYDISFNKNGDDVFGTMSSIVLTYGEELKITKCGFQREGYTFAGWNTLSKPSAENPGVYYPDEYVFQGVEKTQTLVLYAQWEANEYDVIFYNNETSVSFTNPVKATYGQPLDIDTEEYKASASGFEFRGWGIQTRYDSDAFDVSKNYFTKNGDLYGSLSLKAAKDRFDNNEDIYYVKELGEDFRVQGPLTLHALYERKSSTITFDVDGGEAVESITALYGEAITLPTPTKTGYNFGGWMNGDAVYTATTMPSESITLKATWTINKYGIHYETNGGTAKNDVFVNYGTLLGDYLPTDLTKTGYTFGGWYYDEVFDPEVEAQATDTMPAEAITLYAKWTVNSYTITLKYNDASTEDTVLDINYDADYVLPTPTWNGHTFAGWYNGENKWNNTGKYLLTENVILNAHWDLVNYSITYNLNGGNNSTLNPTEYNYDSETIALANPSRTGYTFLGWFSTSTFEEETRVTSILTHSYGDVELYAKWVANKVTVSYNANEGEGTMTDSELTYNGAAQELKENAFSRTGYTFAGWKDKNGNTFTNIPASYFTEEEKELTLYAQWNVNSYALSYNSNGGTAKETVNVNYGEVLADYLPTDLTKTGYEFAGWYYDAELKNIANATDTMPASATTLFAKWNEAEVELKIVINIQNPDNLENYTKFNEYTYDTYKTNEKVNLDTLVDGIIDVEADLEYYELASGLGEITLKATGDTVNVNLVLVKHTVEFLVDSEVVKSVEVPHGTKIGIVDGLAELLEKEGFSPLYNDEASYSNKTINDDYQIVVTYTVNSYALTAHAQGGIFTNETDSLGVSIEYGESFDSVEVPSRFGYTFEGWYFDASYNEKAETMDTTHKHIYAKWIANKVTVSYNANGGTGEMSDSELTYNGAAQELKENAFSRTGYTFAGWKDKNGNTFTNIPASYFTEEEKELTLYAQWNVNSYALSYNSNGGTAKEAVNVNYGEELGDYLPAIVKTGYTFEGWYYDAEFKDAAQATDTMPAEAITLYAKWTVNSYTITLKYNDASTEDTVLDINYDADYVLPTPTWNGHTFAGWYNGENKWNNTGKYLLTENVILNAHWDLVNYSITYNLNGGNNSTLNPTEYNYDSETIALANPSRTGYTFLGWFSTSTFEEETRVTSILTHSYGDVELYAKWVANKVTVSYNANEGEGTMTDSELTYNGAAQELKENAFSRTGYTFAGWKDKNGNTFTNIPASYFTEANRSLELFAQWTANKVTVIYNGNGATSGEMNSNEFTYDGNNHPLASNAFSRTGYHFLGWNTQADGKGENVTSILAGDFDATKTINLYAQWVKNVVVVTFNKNSDKATGGLEPQHYDYDPNGCSISNIAQFFDRFGYQLVGWFDADGNEYTFIPAGYFTEANRSLTLYARWQAMKVKYIVEGNELFVSDFDDSKDFNPSDEFDKYIVDLYGKIQGYNYIYVEAGKQAAFLDNELSIIVLYSYVKQVVTPYASFPTQDAVIGILGGMGVDAATASLLYTVTRNYIQIVALKDLSPVEMVVAIASQNGIPQETALALYGAIYNLLPETLREDPACYAYILLIASIQGYDLTNPQVLQAAVNNISTLYAGIKMNLDSAYQNDTLCYLYMLVTSQVLSIDITDASNLASNVATLSGLYGTVKDLYVNTDPSEIDNAASYIFVAAAANQGNVNLTPTTIPVAVPQFLGTFGKVNGYLKCFPYNEENATLYERILALMVSQDQDTLTALTSYVGIQRDLLIPEYEAYRANGWNPVSTNPNNYFDGWIDTAGQEAVSRTAFYVYRLPKVGAYLESHDAEKVTFTWPSVDPKNVYGYQIEVYVNNVKDEIRTPEHPVVGTLSFPVYFALSGYSDNPEDPAYNPAYIKIKDGDKVEIHIVPLFKGLDGNKQETSHAYAARVLAGQTCSEVEAKPLSGEEAIFNYVHYAESDIDYNPDNTVVGPNFYQYKVGDDRRLVLFTSCDYSFSSADKVELIADDADSIGKVTGTDLVIYNTPADNVIVKLTKGTEVISYKTIINPLLDSINLGTSYRAHQSNRVTSTLTLDTTYSYLASDTSLKPFKVGKALHLNASDASDAGLYDYTDYKHTEGSDYYYNGIKLDFIATAQSGSTIDNNNFEYDVTVKKGTTTLNGNGSENPDYYYDVADNVLYFLTSNCDGLCTIIVTPRVPGAGESLNVTAPQFILEDTNLAKNYGASFTFQVGEGYNVFSHESLSTFFSDTHVKEINILKNIKAVLAPNMVPYVDYCLSLPGSSAYNMILGDEGSKHGEVDIKDGTAHMEKVYSGFKGPKYELIENAGDNYSFIAWYRDGSNETEGRFIYTTKTSGDNIYYIDRGAEWVQNKDTGHFKIMNATPYDGGNTATYAAGLKLANIYSREGAASEALTINGNYFSIDASDMPCIYSVNGVSIGSNTRYHVQSVVVSIFMNATYDPNQLDTSVAFDVANSTANVTVNELTLRGNTANTSRIYSEGEDAYIQTEMEEKSGGINGFATRPYNRSEFNEDVAPSDPSQAVAAYANRKATSNFILNSVNVYDTLIGLYSDTNIDINYTRVDNSWANGFYSHSSNGSTVMKLRNSVIGSSGGAALDIEDTMLGYNPYVDIDYRNVILDNYIAGSEPWLRAYGMEVMALNIKGQLEAAANAQGFTIIQKSTSGAVESELFNFAYFGKVEGASFRQYITDILDKINVEGITSSTPMPGMDGIYMYTNTITEYAPGQYGPEYIFGTADGKNGLILGPSKIPYSTGEHQYLVFFMPQTTIGEYGTVFYGFVEITPLA